MEHRHWHFKFPLSHHLFLSRCLSAPSRCISVCLVSSNLVQSSLVHVLIHRRGGGMIWRTPTPPGQTTHPPKTKEIAFGEK